MTNDTIDNCDEFRPLVAAYALGEQSPNAELAAHLEQCPNCRRDLAEYTRVGTVLAYDAPVAEPSPELRARIVAAVEQQSRPATRPQLAPQPVAERRRWFSWPMFGAVAGAAALLALLFWNVGLQQQLAGLNRQVEASRAGWQSTIAILNHPQVQAFALAGPGASGQLWIAPGQEKACLVVQGLPALDDDHVYQVWLAHDGTAESGGTFDVHGNGGWVLVQGDEPPAAYSAVTVTVEPEGGSQAPSGPPVLIGAITPLVQ